MPGGAIETIDRVTGAGGHVGAIDRLERQDVMQQWRCPVGAASGANMVGAVAIGTGQDQCVSTRISSGDRLQDNALARL